MDAIRRGVDLFNAGAFWEAHEAWEAEWLMAEGNRRLFLQGLIQIAAAYHHVQRGTLPGAIRLFALGLEKLETVDPGYLGVDRAAVVEAAQEHRARLLRGDGISRDCFPKLRYN